jgi:hypothetical protein
VVSLLHAPLGGAPGESLVFALEPVQALSVDRPEIRSSRLGTWGCEARSDRGVTRMACPAVLGRLGGRPGWAGDQISVSWGSDLVLGPSDGSRLRIHRAIDEEDRHEQ